MPRTSSAFSARFGVKVIREAETALGGLARIGAAALLGALLAPAPALAQQQGSISGTVTDPDGLALPGATPEVARSRAEDLLKMPLMYGEDGSGEPLAVTLSVGLTDWRASDAAPRATIARADAALYEAKRDGRHRVNVAA